MYQEYRKVDLVNKLKLMGIGILDIMVTGVTGAGKSTTLRATCKFNHYDTANF